jgi:rRNA maturation endonuclease Nob1
MIRVPLTTIVSLYLFACLVVLCALWLRDERRRARDAARVLQFRLRCAICGFEFEDLSDVPLPPCPRCGRLNERVRIDPL